MVLAAGKDALIIKRDLKDAYRHIVFAPHIRWQLGFQWDGQFYTEDVLPFGLSSAPFIFNLFAEALHWMLESWLGWKLVKHYLDDTITAIQVQEASPARLAEIRQGYIDLTDILGLAR